MGFFKRKDNGPLIPPIPPTAGQQARAADPYAARPNAGGPPARDPYAQNNGGGGAYVAGNSNPYGVQDTSQGDAARNELFSGYAPAQKPVQERVWGYDGRDTEEDFDQDEETEGIKQSMRQTKQDSLASTRNALRLAREAEDNARGTMSRLGEQSQMLANSERHLDIAKANSSRAEDKTAELKALNRSIFLPSVTWNKEGKRLAQEQKIIDRHNMERDDRQKALMDVAETNRRLNSAAGGRGYGNDIVAGKMKARADGRKRYQFESTASDDELEDELDENLDETLDISRRLKMLASGMGEEVSRQNQRIGVITDKTDNLEVKVQLNTDRLRNIH